MADPKGPEGDKNAKPAHSARPRAQTLDLSATDLTSQDAGKVEDKAEVKDKLTDKPKAEGEPVAAGGQAAAAEAAAKAAAAAKPDIQPEPKPAAAQPEPAAASSKPTPPPHVPPPSPPARERKGFGALGFLMAILLGAALAVLVVGLLGPRLLSLPGLDTDRVAAADAKAAALARDLAALRADVARIGDASGIDARLGQLGRAVDGAAGRLGGVETELKALARKVAEPPARDPDVPLLVGRVAGIELRLQDTPTAENYAGLDGRLSGIESRIGNLPSNAAVVALSGRVDAVDAAVGQLDATLRSRPVGDPLARLVVALGALGQALDAGRPFATELKSIRAAGGETAEFASLDAVAANGLPNRRQLGAMVADEIAKLDPAKAGARGSLIERFVASAGGVVKITPIEGEGSDPASSRARVAELGARGDLEGALAARGALDEAARAATEEWARLASARVAAEKAVQSARTAALARLSSND